MTHPKKLKYHYMSYDTIHKDTIELYKKISAEYSPDIIIGIGTGGFIPARILKTFFKIPIICITIEYYNIDNTILNHIAKEIQGITLNSQEHKLIKGKKLLIVDECDDSRATLQYITEYLEKFEPAQMNIGVLHNKLREKKGKLNKNIKYFSLKDFDDIYLMYPWEATNIDEYNDLCENI